MSLRSRWTTSWSIFQASFSVIMAIFFLAPFIFVQTGHHLNETAHWQAVDSMLTAKLTTNSAVASPGTQPTAGWNKTAYTYLGVAYFVSMFLATFFNVAFFSEIIRALRGEAVSIVRGLRFATQRWRSILLWSLLAPLALLIAVCAAAVASNTPLVFAAGGVIWFVTFLGFAYVTGIASRVFQCGLYLYASDGIVPAPFDQGMLNAAWKVKVR